MSAGTPTRTLMSLWHHISVMEYPECSVLSNTLPFKLNSIASWTAVNVLRIWRNNNWNNLSKSKCVFSKTYKIMAFALVVTRQPTWLQLRLNRLDSRFFEEVHRAARHEPAGVVEIECWKDLVHVKYASYLCPCIYILHSSLVEIRSAFPALHVSEVLLTINT